MKKILLMVVGLLIIGSISYTYFNTSKENSIIEDNTKNKQEIQLEKYVNEKFNFSVELPTDSEITEFNRGVSVEYNDKYLYTRLLEDGKYGNGIDDWNYIQIKNYPSEEIELAGNRALKYYIPTYSEGGEQFDDQIIIILEYNNYIYHLEFKSINELSNIEKNIIESFNFIDVEDINNKRQSEIIEKSNDIVNLLKNSNIEQLKKYLHPKKGARITLDGYIREDYDVILKPSELDYLLENETKLLWGYSDGKGDPINLSVLGFFKEYFSYDFTDSDSVVNEIRQGGSNSIDNLTEIYPNKDFVNYYIPYASTYLDEGVEKPQTLDWHALNLVFDEYQGKIYLIGIIKDNWTI